MSSTPIRLFDHWTLAVSDVDRASAFYEEIMGWRPARRDTDSDDEAWGCLPGRTPARASRRFVRDGQRIELCTFRGNASRATVAPQVHHAGLSHMTVATAPSDDVLRALRRRGVHVREHTRSSFVPGMEEPGTQFLFEDPDGNVIETYEAGDDWNAFAGVGASDVDGTDAGIRHLSHWSLCVSDPTRALRFYRDVLGWRELAALDWEGEGPSRVMDVGEALLTTWLLAAADQRIEIIHFAQPPVVARAGSGVSATGLSHMTVVVDDAGDAATRLTAAGYDATITSGSSGKAVVFHDPDGNVIRGVPEPPTWDAAR